MVCCSDWLDSNEDYHVSLIHVKFDSVLYDVKESNLVMSPVNAETLQIYCIDCVREVFSCSEL